MRTRYRELPLSLGVFLLSLAVSGCTGTRTSTTGIVMLGGKNYLVQIESREEMDENKGDSFAVSVDGGAGQWLHVGTTHGFGAVRASALLDAPGGAPNDEFKRVHDAWYADEKARKNVQTESHQYFSEGYGYPGALGPHGTIPPYGSGNETGRGGQ